MNLFIFRDGGVSGPFEEESLRKAFASGEIPGDAQVCFEGEEVWHPIATRLGNVATASIPAAPQATRDEKYWAFISYSHKDKAIADWLHKKLEGYRIPAPLAGRLGRDVVIPDRLFPVFRDREELPTSSNLSQSIQEALAASRYLIVICSPRSAVSQWVNAEIASFDAMGKRDRILALIIDGEPHANIKNLAGVDECFPPALRLAQDPDDPDSTESFEPIASDLRPGGDSPERALLKIVAGIIGVNFDELFQRERRRKRQRQVFAYVSIAIGLLLLVCLFLWNSHLQRRQESVATEVETMKQQGPYKEFGKLPKDRQQLLAQKFEKLDVDGLIRRSAKITIPSKLVNLSVELKKIVDDFKAESFHDWDHLEAAFKRFVVQTESYAHIDGREEMIAMKSELESMHNALLSGSFVKDLGVNLEEKIVAEQIATELDDKVWSECSRLQDIDSKYLGATLRFQDETFNLRTAFLNKCSNLNDYILNETSKQMNSMNDNIREKEHARDKLLEGTDISAANAKLAEKLNAECDTLRAQSVKLSPDTGIDLIDGKRDKLIDEFDKRVETICKQEDERLLNAKKRK